VPDGSDGVHQSGIHSLSDAHPTFVGEINSMSLVNVGDRTYRVLFIHSGHDLKQDRGTQNPGGYRHFIDDVAKSLNRRVTLAEISLMQAVEGSDYLDQPIIDFVPVAYGIAVCHYTDTFVREDGRGLALLRALRNAKRVFNTETRDAIIESTGFGSFITLKQRYGGHPPATPDSMASPVNDIHVVIALRREFFKQFGRTDAAPTPVKESSSLAGLLYPSQAPV
jgi:hypothetical protein